MIPGGPSWLSQLTEYSTRDSIWLLRLDHKGVMHFCLVLSGYLFLQPRNHSVKSPKQSLRGTLGNTEPQLRSQLTASINHHSYKLTSLQMIPASHSAPVFESFQLRLQTSWNRDRAFPLSPFQFLIYWIYKQYKVLFGHATKLRLVCYSTTIGRTGHHWRRKWAMRWE